MKIYDNIVVGSGISGMTLALLLGANGRRVLLLEKAPYIGGSMCRFYKQGVPFDTGFHFTGGFSSVLSQMLTVLDIDKYIEPLFISDMRNNRFVFENTSKSYSIPMGYEQVRTAFKKYFPCESAAVDTFFNKIKDICDNTASMDLTTITDVGQPCDEDFKELSHYIGTLTSDRDLTALFCAYTMCIGTRPSQLSFAAYARAAYALYDSVARVRNGGDAFIAAFKEKSALYDIDVLTNTHIKECKDVKNRRVGTFVLSDGTEMASEQCIFTIHPYDILKTLGRSNVSRAFAERIDGYELSSGFFSVFAVVDETEEFEPSIVSLYPNADIENMFNRTGDDIDSAMVIMKSCEESRGIKYNVLNVFELSDAADVEQWKMSSRNDRPAAYYEYKTKKTNRILERVISEFPEYAGKINVLDSASMLTFSDYLNSPYGCAYGIKQKVAQFNLFGRLPLKNIYAAGQSSVLPGLVGAMLSSFVVARSLIGRDGYSEFINTRLAGGR